jgi:RimJ/RimL family protein N-acetyltransferase
VANATERNGVLREVVEADIPVFFEHQRDPEANRMALFPPRDSEAFAAHWQRILASDEVEKKTILFEGAVAGNILCFERDGKRLVGYWIGREFWGRGLATKALAELLAEVTERPLYAYVATANPASIRVLEKCGFVIAHRQTTFDETLGEEVEELLMELR